MHFAEPPSGSGWWLQAEPTQQMSMHRRASQRQPLASDSPSVQARGAGAGGSGRRMQAEGPPGTAGWAQPAFSPQQMSKQAPPLRQVQPVSRRSPGPQALGGVGCGGVATGSGVARGGAAGAGASSFTGSAGGCRPSGSGGREQASASAPTSAASRPAPLSPAKTSRTALCTRSSSPIGGRPSRAGRWSARVIRRAVGRDRPACGLRATISRRATRARGRARGRPVRERERESPYLV